MELKKGVQGQCTVGEGSTREGELLYRVREEAVVYLAQPSTAGGVFGPNGAIPFGTSFIPATLGYGRLRKYGHMAVLHTNTAWPLDGACSGTVLAEELRASP
jgi:hypothetical protein